MVFTVAFDFFAVFGMVFINTFHFVVTTIYSFSDYFRYNPIFSRTSPNIYLEFIPTKKNSVAKDFYKNNGFKLMHRESEKEIWEYDTKKEYSFPRCIKLAKKDFL